jgi:primosomal replication protein N
VTPAGIPLNRFVVEHRSQQTEAGLDRQTQLKIMVIASGKPLDKTVQGLTLGEHVIVKGFLNRTVFKSGDYRIVVHAESVEST